MFYVCSAPVGVWSIEINLSVCLYVCVSVCLSASTSLEPLDRSAQNFVCRSPVAMARSSAGSFALHYVLLVLWMTSHLAIMGMTLAWVGNTQRHWWCDWGGVWCLWMFVNICDAGSAMFRYLLSNACIHFVVPFFWFDMKLYTLQGRYGRRRCVTVAVLCWQFALCCLKSLALPFLYVAH